jgi:hypothetical protein
LHFRAKDLIFMCSKNMADWRWPRHRPSAWAAAALLITAAAGDGGDGDGDTELLALINAPEVSAAQCHCISTIL